MKKKNSLIGFNLNKRKMFSILKKSQINIDLLNDLGGKGLHIVSHQHLQHRLQNQL